MDEVDLAILRELGRDQVAGVGNLDPQLSLNEVARRAELPPSTVSKRVRDWEADGFLVERSLWPSPELLGAGMAALSVHAPGLHDRAGLVEDIGLIDGVLLVFEHVEPWLGVLVAHEDEAVLARRRRLLERVLGVEGVGQVIALASPHDGEAPSDLQWRLVRALYEDPEAELHEIAERLGVSTRTVTRKLDPLIEARALWSVFGLDFRCWTGSCMVRFLLTIDEGRKRPGIVEAVREQVPKLMFINNSVHGPDVSPDRWIDLLTPLTAAAAIPEARRRLAGIAGVAEVEALIPRRIHVFDHWFEPRLEERAADVGAT